MNKIYGIIFCLVIALPAYILGNKFPVIGGPVFAILLGMIISEILRKAEKNNEASVNHLNDITSEGIKFTSKKILQYAVILLGFGMNLEDIIKSGKESLPVIISTIFTSLIVSYILTKALKLDRKIGILVGVGSSICGGSAIAAAAPAINADDEEIAKSISVIFLFNIIAAIIFPALGQSLGLSNEGFGLFAGTAINDTSSVTAAASAWDSIHNAHTLEIATVVKLTRTLAIIPITLVLSIYENRRNAKISALSGENVEINRLKVTSLVPSFIVLFIVASVITTVFNLNGEVVVTLKHASKFFITMAMGAIGLNTDIVKLVKTGGKAILVGFICWICISVVSLVMQHAIGIV